MTSAAAPGLYHVFRNNRALSLLVAGEGLSSLADWLLAVTLTVVVYDISHSGTTVSLLTFTRLAPYALVLPWSGLVLDRMDRRLLMTGLGVGRALCMVGLLFVQSSVTLPLAFPLVFLSGSLSCLLRPTINATLPVLVGDSIAVNSMVTLVDGAAHVAGPALAGVFVLTHTTWLAFVVAAGTFLLSGVALFFTSVHTRTSIDLSVREALAGFRFLFRENERVLVALTATAAGLALLAGAYYVLAVVLSTQTFHFGGQGVGWLDAVYGVGGLAGSLLLGLVLSGRRIAYLFIGGAVLNCLGVVLLAISPSGPLPFAFIALVGIAGAVVQITATTLMQAAAPRDMLGRAFTAFEAALVGAMLIGALAAGPLVKVAGPRWATISFALTGGLLLVLSLPQLRRLEDVLGVRIFLRGVPMLADLARPLLDDLARSFEVVTYSAGALVVREGDPGDQLYIVHSGTVEISVKGRMVRRLGPGSYFGEVALLRPVPRTASVRASTPVSLYALDRTAFEDLLRRDRALEPRLVTEARAEYHYGPAATVFLH